MLWVGLLIILSPEICIAQEDSQYIKGRFYLNNNLEVTQEYIDNVFLSSDEGNRVAGNRLFFNPTGELKYKSLRQDLNFNYAISSVRYLESKFEAANHTLYYLSLLDTVRLIHDNLYLTLNNTYGIQARDSEELFLRANVPRGGAENAALPTEGDTQDLEEELLSNPELANRLIQTNLYSAALDFKKDLSPSMLLSVGSKYFRIKSFSDAHPSSIGYGAKIGLDKVASKRIRISIGYGYLQEKFEFLDEGRQALQYFHTIDTLLSCVMSERTEFQLHGAHNIFDYKDFTSGGLTLTHKQNKSQTLIVRTGRDHTLYTTGNIRGGFINSYFVEGSGLYTVSKHAKLEVTGGYQRDTGIVFIRDNRKWYAQMTASKGFNNNLSIAAHGAYAKASLRTLGGRQDLVSGALNISYFVSRYLTARFAYRHEIEKSNVFGLNDYRLNVVSLTLIGSYNQPREGGR